MSQAHDAKTGDAGRATETQRDDFDTAKSGHGTADGAVKDIESGGTRTESDTPNSSAPSSFTKMVVYILAAILVVALCVAAGCYFKQNSRLASMPAAEKEQNADSGNVVPPKSDSNTTGSNFQTPVTPIGSPSKDEQQGKPFENREGTPTQVQQSNANEKQVGHEISTKDVPLGSREGQPTQVQQSSENGQQDGHEPCTQAQSSSNGNNEAQEAVQQLAQPSSQSGTDASKSAPSTDRDEHGKVSESKEIKYLFDSTKSHNLPLYFIFDKPEIKKKLLLKALQWRTFYHNIVLDNTTTTTYSIKPISITDNVFTKIIVNDSNKDALDYSFAVMERQFDQTKLNDVDEVLNTFESEFEWKHFYAYYSILDEINEKNVKYTYLSKLLRFDIDKSEAQRNMNDSIILKLLNCYNESEMVYGKTLIRSVMQSDLFNVLVTMYAKCAGIVRNDLEYITFDWERRFPMWYLPSRQNVNYSSFKGFASDFLKSMRHALHYCHQNIKDELKKNLSLQAVLHLTLIYRYCKFNEGYSSGSSLTKCSNFKLEENRTYRFDQITKFHIKGIPIYKDLNTALLPDAPPNVWASNAL